MAIKRFLFGNQNNQTK